MKYIFALSKNMFSCWYFLNVIPASSWDTNLLLENYKYYMNLDNDEQDHLFGDDYVYYDLGPYLGVTMYIMTWAAIWG